jgi:hypothetical protein
MELAIQEEKAKAAKINEPSEDAGTVRTMRKGLRNERAPLRKGTWAEFRSWKRRCWFEDFEQVERFLCGATAKGAKWVFRPTIDNQS